MTPLLVVIGAPGAGKTTVGRLVADARGVPFRDTDADIEAAEGRAIGDIFVDDGEEHFRVLEQAAVRQALATHDGVLALGGGAPLAAETRTVLAGHRVVYLRVGLSNAASRVGLNRDRPLLLGNPRAQLRALLAEREPVYSGAATRTVDTDGRPPADIAADILTELP